MKKTTLVIFSVMLAISIVLPYRPLAAGILETPFPAPEFSHQAPQDWINSAPLSVRDLAGKVTLIDFWTFDCWNCYRSFPWLNAMEKRLAGEDFQIIGVHTPEFEREKIRANIVRKVEEFELHHPIMIDNNHAYWRAVRNRYWPAFYIIDKRGQIRAIYVGETHEGQPRAREIEQTIHNLLAEPA